MRHHDVGERPAYSGLFQFLLWVFPNNEEPALPFRPRIWNLFKARRTLQGIHCPSFTLKMLQLQW